MVQALGDRLPVKLVGITVMAISLAEDGINENCYCLQDVVASTLKLSANKVMCHVRRVGGAFGGKVGKTSIMAAITAFAASK